jgi:hypothetical protein
VAVVNYLDTFLLGLYRDVHVLGVGVPRVRNSLRENGRNVTV